MDRAPDEIFPSQKRPRTSGLQGETERTGPSSQGSSFDAHGSGNQLNAPGGTVNKSTGTGNHFTGAKFSGPVYFGTKEHFDPLRECSRSLAFPEMDSRFNDIDTAAKGTCEWLLRHETCTSWASCDRGLLWIKGKPGSGKSTLLRHVLNDIRAIPNTREGALILKFFFHGRGSELQRTPLGLFRSLLYQLREVPDALSDLVATFEQRCENVGKPGEKWQWHPRELQRSFELSLLKVLNTCPVWLLVDALDECGEENAVNLAEEFKSLLQRFPPSGLKQFHICFTCRHYPILDLDGVFEVCVEKENRKDISTFVQDKLSSFRGRTSSRIPELITNRADGVFMWAWLVVKQVLDLERKGAGLKEIEAVILSVPQELDALYRDLIRNMGPESLKLVQWICFATRPLSLDELRWAMAIEPDCRHRLLRECESAGDFPPDYDGMKRRVQTLSRGLAEVTSDTKVAQFIHQSVKDFFVEKGLSALDENAKPDLVLGIAHFRLSRICIRYLAMEEIGRSGMHERYPYHLKSNFPFLPYATTSWVAHTKESDARNVPQEDLLEYFAGPLNTLMERWVHIYRILRRYSIDCPPEGTSIVHVMSRYGVAGALWAILGRADQVSINIDGKDSDGRTPLVLAARIGHEAAVRLLLERGARIEAADKDGRTPLSYAAERGPEAAVRLLLERGARIEAADKDGRTPLSYAAERGHEAAVRLLLERGARIEAADKDGRTPLLWAAASTTRMGLRSRPQATVQATHALQDYQMQLMLLEQQNNERLMMARSWAAERGHKAIVRLLLDRGARIEAADKDGRTPLSYAAERGPEAAVRLLLERGAHADAADKMGQMPLSYATKNRQEAAVRLLQFHGAQPSSTTSP